MSAQRPITKLHKGRKQQLHLLSARCCVFSSLAVALASLLEFAARHWPFALLFASFAVLYGSLAFVQYALSRKASGE